MYIKWKSESTQEARPVVSTTCLFWQDKKTALLPAHKLPASNALGDADVLQGPHRGHRRGRKRRHIRPFLTGLKFVSKVLSLNIHTPCACPEPEEEWLHIISGVNVGDIGFYVLHI